MSLSNNLYRGALALLLSVSAGACGDDNPAGFECGAGTTESNGECVADAPITCAAGTMLMGTTCIPQACPTGSTAMNGVCTPNTSITYRQVEELGRPGIAEALLITPAYLEAYNAVAPSFAGAPPAAVAAVSAEAKTVLKAIFHGVCLLNGVVGFGADDGAKPGGVTCAAVGLSVFSDAGGTTVATAQAAQATVYADKVFGQFITDVLRIDTGVASNYLTPCNATLAAGMPLLCGGRQLNDDVIDMTYYYLLSGAVAPTGTNATNLSQVVALVTDGVFFSPLAGQNSGIFSGNTALGTPDPNNRNQFHQSCANCETRITINTATFPYSAAPH